MGHGRNHYILVENGNPDHVTLGLGYGYREAGTPSYSVWEHAFV